MEFGRQKTSIEEQEELIRRVVEATLKASRAEIAGIIDAHISTAISKRETLEREMVKQSVDLAINDRLGEDWHDVVDFVRSLHRHANGLSSGFWSTLGKMLATAFVAFIGFIIWAMAWRNG